MKPQDRLMVATLVAAAFTVMLNETVVGVALHPLTVEFGTSATNVLWVTSAYMLTMAIVMPSTGYLLSRVPTRTLYIVATVVMLAGTLIAAVAPDLFWLIVGRVVQAAGSASILPMLLTAMMRIVRPSGRGRALGIVSVVTAVAPAIGPSLSGLVLTTLSWRWLFILELPLCIALIIVGRSIHRQLTAPGEGRLDVASVALTAIGFGGTAYAFSRVTVGGSAWQLTAASAAIGVAAICAFCRRQIRLQRRGNPLLDLRPLLRPTFALSAGILALLMLALFGVFAVFPLFLQETLLLTPFAAGALMLPGGLAMGFAAPLIGRWQDAGHTRNLLVCGSVALLTALIAATFAGPATWPVWLAIHLGIGCSFALLVTPLYAAALGSLPTRFYAHGGAILGVVQQLTGAVGTAVAIGVAAGDGMQASFLVAASVTVPVAVGCLLLRPTSRQSRATRNVDARLRRRPSVSQSES